MKIQAAQTSQSLQIARLIMQAMNYDCCSHFTGPDYTLGDFERVMESLVLAEDSQYSYRNTLVAVGCDGELCGICVSYDGGRLHELRKAFITAVRDNFGRDFSGMDDETSAGELYIDSIAVPESCRGRGVATLLLNAVKDKAEAMGLPAVGLLVDKDNPKAEKLYVRVGFRHVGDNTWGGHGMRHLQYIITENN